MNSEILLSFVLFSFFFFFFFTRIEMWKSQLLIDFNNRLSSWFVCLWAFAPAFCSHLLAWDFTDVLGWVCVGSVRVVKTEGELVAGLSCIFSQRLKQSRDEVAAFLRLLRFEWIYRFTWMMYDHYLQLFQCRSCCHTHPFTAFTPILAIIQTHTYTLHRQTPRPAAIDWFLEFS